jgi:hypothetical protein
MIAFLPWPLVDAGDYREVRPYKRESQVGIGAAAYQAE